MDHSWCAGRDRVKRRHSRLTISMRCGVSDKLNLPGHAAARIGSARRGWCSWTAAVFGGRRRATPWSPGPRKHIEGRITGSRLATTTKSWSSPWPHASALRAVTPAWSPSPVRESAPQPSASSPVNGTDLQYAGWVLRVAATRKSGSARVVVACCIVVVDQRSAAAALQSEISVAEQDFDDARRGRMPGVRRGTGRSGVSVACSRSHRALRATSPLEGGRSR